MHVDLGACNLYADDTLVYCSANNINELQECTQKCVTAIKEWKEGRKEHIYFTKRQYNTYL